MFAKKNQHSTNSKAFLVSENVYAVESLHDIIMLIK